MVEEQGTLDSIGGQNLIVQHQDATCQYPPKLVTQHNVTNTGTSITKEEGLDLSTTVDSLVCSKLEATINNSMLPHIANAKM